MGWLGSGPRLVGWLGLGPCLVGRIVGQEYGLVPVFKKCPPRGSVRVRTWVMADSADVVPADKVDVVVNQTIYLRMCVF